MNVTLGIFALFLLFCLLLWLGTRKGKPVETEDPEEANTPEEEKFLKSIQSNIRIAEKHLGPYITLNIKPSRYDAKVLIVEFRFLNSDFSESFIINGTSSLSEKEQHQYIQQYCQERYLYWWNRAEEEKKDLEQFRNRNKIPQQISISDQDLARWVLEGKPGARTALQERVHKNKEGKYGT